MNLPAAPPQNIDAERRVLGTLLAYYTPEMVTVITGIGLKWSDFSWDAHRIVYRAVLKMSFDHEHVDTLTVARFLMCRRHERDGTYLEAAGGEARLEELVCHASVNGWREAARIVAEDGRWRRWLAATFEALESIHARDENGFWAAVSRVREDVLPSEPLRVIEGGEQAA